MQVSSQPENTLPDLESVREALDLLSSPPPAPLFLAVGLHKPHVPHKFPMQYLDFHPISSVKLPNNSQVFLLLFLLPPPPP